MGRFDALKADMPKLTTQKWAGPGGGVHWVFDTLTPGMAMYAIEKREAMAQVAEAFAEYAEEYMFDHAPWEDQSGDARLGLKAEAEHTLFSERLHLYHSVDYGIWLETRWSGQYAIIVPTMEKIGPEMMAAMAATDRYMP